MIRKRVLIHKSLRIFQESISEALVKRFCKESQNLRLIRTGSSLASEYEGESPHKSAIGSLFEGNPESEVMYYFILRGVDRFVTDFNTIPGNMDDHVEPDIGKLKTCVGKIMAEYQMPASVVCKDDYIHEVCRYGGAELHAMASILGGCASQEVIKLVTSQYVPVNNLFIYNTMTSATLQTEV